MAFYADHKVFVFEALNFSKAFIFSEFDFINVNGLSFLSVKRFNWPPRGSLVDEVRKEIQLQLLDDGGAPASAPPLQADKIVESAAKRGVVIVRRQRKLLARLLGVASVTLKESEEMQLITRETLEKRSTKARAKLVAALTKTKLEGMRAVSQVLSQAIPLERLAYSLDDDKGGAVPIKYVAPAYTPTYSGLSEDQWA